jgi:adenylate cyclase
MIENGTYDIKLFREGRSIPSSKVATILESTLASGIDHMHACGGNAKCSTCRVSITEGIEHCHPRNEEEANMAEKLKFPAEIRLACQTKIKGDISIRRMVGDEMDLDIISEQFSTESEVIVGKQQKLTIVFIDIVKYSSFAEKFPPYDIVHVLSRYYRIMNTVIKMNRGIISDVAGDGILAVFGECEKTDNSVLDAILAIEGMKKKLNGFNKYLTENFNSEFDIRAGIHFGNVIVGPFDTGEMRKLAVIGDNVNYASRIESANKEFGTDLLLSEEAYAEIEYTYPVHRIHRTTLKGKTGQYELIEIL